METPSDQNEIQATQSADSSTQGENGFDAEEQRAFDALKRQFSDIEIVKQDDEIVLRDKNTTG